MSSPKTPDTPAPPQPDAPAAKAILASEDSPVDAVKKRTAQRTGLRAAYLTASPGEGAGVQL